MLEANPDPIDTMLCVGGPLAGQRYAVHHGKGFTVPVRVTVPEGNPQDCEPAIHPSPEFTDYRQEMFTTGQGRVTFWVPARQTQLDTMKLLLESYEQKPPAPRNEPAGYISPRTLMALNTDDGAGHIVASPAYDTDIPVFTRPPSSGNPVPSCNELSLLEAYEIKLAAAIGTCRFMDPPDGGDVSLVEQVRRMRSDLDEAEDRSTARKAEHEAWSYELDYPGRGWTKEFSDAKHGRPGDNNVLRKDAIRNIKPLYAAPPTQDAAREAIRSALETELVAAYDCTRVWDAWHAGTMTEDDFTAVTNRLDEIVDSVIAALSATPLSVPSDRLSDLRDKAFTAAVAFEEAASQNETEWTGWGEQIVPPGATMARVKAEQAVSALRDAFAPTRNDTTSGGSRS